MVPVVALRSLLLLALCGALAGCASGPPADLLIISLDTTRADHLPTYGYERDTMPTLDTLAEKGVVFDRAFAQDVNTNPSHATMFTGLYPHEHGSRWNGVVLPEGRVTLAQMLSAAGFRTGGFVSGITLKKATTGLDRGFEEYDDDFDGERRDGALTAERALDWLDRHRSDERRFLFLHLFDAHGPYLPKESHAALFESEDPGPEIEIPHYQRLHDDDGELIDELGYYVDRYDAMLRYMDDLLALFLDRVDLDRTLVVVIADHGETLDERYHKLNHGAQLFDEQLRIPFFIRAPGLDARRVGAFVETTDLLPTLLELLEVERDPASREGAGSKPGAVDARRKPGAPGVRLRLGARGDQEARRSRVPARREAPAAHHPLLRVEADRLPGRRAGVPRALRPGDRPLGVRERGGDLPCDPRRPPGSRRLLARRGAGLTRPRVRPGDAREAAQPRLPRRVGRGR